MSDIIAETTGEPAAPAAPSAKPPAAAGESAPAPVADLRDPALYINRQISWLASTSGC